MKIFDAHFHIIDFNYPVVENNGYLPPEFTSEDYSKAIEQYQIIGGAIVSGSFQAFDQEYLKRSLNELGENFYGVANIASSMNDEDLDELAQHHIAAVRFNLKRGGSATIADLEYLSNKLYERYGWHTELYVDSKDLKELKTLLHKIKHFSIDHLGLSKDGLDDLYFWVEQGIKVKASGFGRIDFDPIIAMKQIHSINPAALMFGTDMPSTRAKIPFSEMDVHRIKESFDQKAQEQIFYQNASDWYSKAKYLDESNYS